MKTRPSISWVLLALIALSLFVVRGPIRALSGSSDLRGPFTAAVAWTTGHNPYDSDQLTEIHKEKGGEGRKVQLLHPPSVLPILAPLSFLSWKEAKLAWTIVNVLSLVLLASALRRITPGLNSSHRQTILILLIIAYAPVHTAIQLGQLSLSSIATGLMAVALLPTRRIILSACLLALSVALKPQIGLVFLAYLLASFRFKAFAYALLMSLVPLAIGLIGIAANETPLAEGTEWRQNMSESNSVKGGDRFSESNPARSNLLNLHVFFYALTPDPKSVSAGVPLTILAGCFCWFLLHHRRNREPATAVSLGVPLVLSLLVVYHRTYDAILLLLPMSWAITEWKGPHATGARIVLLLGAVFAVPGGALIAWAQTNNRLPTPIVEHPAWKMFVVPHASIALLMISICLVLIMMRSRPHPNHSVPDPG